MTEAAFSLDREANIRNGIDATGRKWGIKSVRGSGMCYARPIPDREDAVIPKLIAGNWTKQSLLAPRIELYCKRSWDEADRIKLKNSRPKPVVVPDPTEQPEDVISEAAMLEAAEAEGTATPEEAVEALIEDPITSIQAQIDADNAEFEARNAARAAELAQDS
jgi:hypothetical protein